MRLTSLRQFVGALTSAALIAGTATGIAPPASGAAIEEYAVPGDGIIRIQGGGWGHGRGMSQWGAYQAALEGRSFAEILDFYYPGTGRSELPGSTVRVLLATDTGRNVVVRAVPGLTASFTVSSGDRVVELAKEPTRCKTPPTRWRARAVRKGVRLMAYCKRWVTVVPGKRIESGRITFEVPGGIVGTQSRQVRRGYRGAVTADRLGARTLRAINTLPMDTYLRPVVAAEVSPSWPVESLRAQAVAARSYAAHEALGRAGTSFDVYDSVRSQAYPGAVWYDRRWQVVRDREHARTNQAIADTAGIHVTADGKPALTQFSSSNGGATAKSPLPYMVAAVDEWDRRATPNSRRTWTDSVSASALRARYPSAGAIRAIRVLVREGAGSWGGRVSKLEVVGANRSYTLTSDSAIRAALGVHSSFLTFTA